MSITPQISEVYIMNVSEKLEHRTTKHCICISAGNNKYVLINSEHREMYDDFKINVSDYDFLRQDSYVGCSEVVVLKKESIIRKVGSMKYNDMLKILEKIRGPKHISKPDRAEIVLELEEWMSNYQENKLKNKFNKK